eukprot:Skav218087  [mRNA]  locus=scaffold3382:139242:139637:- [translate_table: standard]
MNSMENLNDQIADVEVSSQDSDQPVANPEDDETQQMALDVIKRVERFERAMVDLSSLPQDDPFWIESFNRIIEELSATSTSVNDIARLKLNVVSGCSGMLAEGWVLKAGSSKTRKENIRGFFSSLSFHFPK